MKTKQILLSMIMITAFLITACGGGIVPAEDAMMEKPTDAAMSDETPMADAMIKETPTPDASMPHDTPTVEAAMAAHAWYSASLAQVNTLHSLLGQRDDFVSIGLDIDPNEDSASLKSYVENNGFNWLYAVSTADVSNEISALYGAQFLNPPSTPIVIIDRDGEAHPMPFGLKSADELLKFIQPFLDEAM